MQFIHNSFVLNQELLKSAIDEAQKYLGEIPPPPNEANTCDWVIRPLLVSIGYLNHEIHAQSGDVASKFPDYTILPQTNNTWYLEAKSWSIGLDSIHVDQAMNYAHSNGQRWVVLSNGREWRLYDDRIPGKSADRLVATSHLEDTQSMIRFLGAISRSSILAANVEDFANERRVKEYLTREITRADSPVIDAILKAVKNNLRVSNISGSVIVDILNAAQSAVVSDLAQIVSMPSNESSLPSPAGTTSGQRKKGNISEFGRPTLTLAGFEAGTYQQIPGRCLCFPDQSKRQLKFWKDVLVSVASWLAESGRLDTIMPIDLGGSTRFLMNTEPIHKNGVRFTEPYPAGLYFVETHYSAHDCVRHAQRLLTKCGVDLNHVSFG